MPPQSNAWVTVGNVDAPVRLFCFSYAGGGTSIFHSWAAALPAEVALCPVRLPGRESRLAEKPFTALHEIIEPLAHAISHLLDAPYLFYGHSMGGFVGFELARYLRAAGAPMPSRLLVSGCRAPHLPDPEPPVVHLPDDEFVAELRRLNGTPQAVFENPELLQLLLPCIRADFRAVEEYRYEEGAPLDVPIVGFAGSRDEKADRGLMEPWTEHTTRGFSLHVVEGDHFFIHSQRAHFLSMLADSLNQAVRQYAPS